MDFNNRVYQLRKGKGMSQEELASRLNVSRQTISKWETGDSTPDMEKLIAIRDLFDVSLDELVLGEEKAPIPEAAPMTGAAEILDKKVLTIENKKRVKGGMKIAAIIIGAVIAIDLISMIIYFALYGAPK